MFAGEVWAAERFCADGLFRLCSWLARRTLNPEARVQVPAGTVDGRHTSERIGVNAVYLNVRMWCVEGMVRRRGWRRRMYMVTCGGVLSGAGWTGGVMVMVHFSGE